MSVVNLADRRRSSAPRADDGVCECGGRWFRPVIEDVRGERPGAVVIDSNGDVCGYAGVMRCVECGHDFKP